MKRTGAFVTRCAIAALILLGGAFTRETPGAPAPQSLPTLYLCGDNTQSLAELQQWNGGTNDVKFMQFIDRNPVTGAPGSAWPTRITASFIDQLVSQTPTGPVPIMLDREDALYESMLRSAGAEQLTAERWFDRMQDRVSTARARAPLVGWYIGLLGYRHPPDLWWAWWRGERHASGPHAGNLIADEWAQAHSQAYRMAELLSNERNAVYVCVYSPSDEAWPSYVNAKLALAPWVELRRDAPGKVIACVSDRLINMRPDNDTPTLSEETFRAQIRGALAATGPSGKGKIDGLVLWHADPYYRRFLEPNKPTAQLLADSKAHLARCVQIMREEAGYAPPPAPPAPPAPAPTPPVVIAPAPATQPAPPTSQPATQPDTVTMLDSDAVTVPAGDYVLANLRIASADKGIEGDNATKPDSYETGTFDPRTGASWMVRSTSHASPSCPGTHRGKILPSRTLPCMHTLALVRHAVAEDRQAWRGDDALRPLTSAGQRQARRIAEALEDMLEGLTLVAVRTSRALRCVQTLEPFLARTGMRPQVAADLFEGARIVPPSPRDDGAFVLCGHGDNIPWLLEDLAVHWNDRCKKGSIWLVRRDGRGRVADAAYHAIDKS